MELRTVFIENLKKYRKERKISQMKLAELCGTSTSYIGEIEIAKKFPSIEMIQKMAAALEISPYKLFMSENDENLMCISEQSRETLIEKLQEDIRKIVENESLYVTQG